MRILTEQEYERRLEKARREGAREQEIKAMERAQYEGFQRGVWDDLERIQRAFTDRLDQIEKQIAFEKQMKNELKSLERRSVTGSEIGSVPAYTGKHLADG